DSLHVLAVAPLPERPAEAAPAAAGQDRQRCRGPVSDPERVAVEGEDRRVAEVLPPERRRGVDDRPDAEPGADLVEPRLRPRGQARSREVACLLEVERWQQVAGGGLRER